MILYYHHTHVYVAVDSLDSRFWATAACVTVVLQARVGDRREVATGLMPEVGKSRLSSFNRGLPALLKPLPYIGSTWLFP